MGNYTQFYIYIHDPLMLKNRKWKAFEQILETHLSHKNPDLAPNSKQKYPGCKNNPGNEQKEKTPRQSPKDSQSE